MKIFKFEIAKVQLEEAIIQHLDRKNYIAAITLAGAAEEILGKSLPSKQTPALHKLIQRIKIQHPKLVILDRKGRSQRIEDVQDQDIEVFLNRIKNSLKHIQSDFIEIALKEESVTMLSRALTNYVTLQLTPSRTIKRGMKFFKEYAIS